MEQKKKHDKAEIFRAHIHSVARRASAIQELVQKTSYDEMDRLCLKILLSKVTYTTGCEKEYKTLLAHLMATDMQSNAMSFYKKWHD